MRHVKIKPLYDEDWNKTFLMKSWQFEKEFITEEEARIYALDRGWMIE